MYRLCVSNFVASLRLTAISKASSIVLATLASDWERKYGNQESSASTCRYMYPLASTWLFRDPPLSFGSHDSWEKAGILTKQGASSNGRE